jgi:tRNA(Leu) C34 or U34 (ribose-2'-O)-methylase TrmL
MATRSRRVDSPTDEYSGAVDSLNAAAAGSILLYEAARQRRAASGGA